MTAFWDVLQLFYTFKIFRHHWSTQWLSKVVCAPGQIGSERCEAIGLCNAGNLGDSSPWDMHFPSSKPSSLPDNKLPRLCPSAQVLHQNNVMGHSADSQGRSSGMAKAGSTFHGMLQESLPTAASPGGPALPPSAHGQNREVFSCGSHRNQAGAENWHVSQKPDVLHSYREIAFVI